MTGTYLAIITPVFNDWDAVKALIAELDTAASQWQFNQVDLFIVDDGSWIDGSTYFSTLDAVKNLGTISIIKLYCNLGHQRAIATGLSHILQLNKYTHCVVMDCDGEDRPESIRELLCASQVAPDSIVVAKRSKRIEGVIFSFFYSVYKFLFKALSGKVIEFGNFCLLPVRHIDRIAHMTDLWNHFAATLIKSGLPLIGVPIPRGKRYAGRSSMRLTTLIIHGLSAIAVFSEFFFVRLLFFSLLFSALPILLAIVVFFLKVFTNTAIPGWATTVFGFVSVILLQIMTVCIASLFTQLNGRSSKAFCPAIDASSFICSVLIIDRVKNSFEKTR